MSRFAMQSGQAVTMQFAPASRAIVMQLVDHLRHDRRVRLMERLPPQQSVLKDHGLARPPRGRQDLVEEDRVFVIVELADLGRPQQQAAVIGNGLQPLSGFTTFSFNASRPMSLAMMSMGFRMARSRR